MAEVYKAEQAQISGVEQEAAQKKQEELKQALAAKHDVFFSQASEAGKLFVQAETVVSDAKGKESIKKDKEGIRSHLVKVAEKGRTILAAEKSDKPHPELASIGTLASSISGYVANAKTEVPIYMAIEKARGLHQKAQPDVKKALTFKDPKERANLKNWQVKDQLNTAISRLEEADGDLQSYHPENFPSDAPRQMLAELRGSIASQMAELAGISLTVREGAELEDPELSKLSAASQAYEKGKDSLKYVMDLKEKILSEKTSPATFKDRVSKMYGSARAAFDHLLEVNQHLKQIKSSAEMGPEYQVLYQQLLMNANKDLQDVADVKLYCVTHDLVESAEMNKYFVFKADGTVEETSAFKGLDVWTQQELLKKLHSLPIQIQLEMEEKMATPEEKNLIEGKKKMAGGDWIGAKTDLLKYYNETAGKEGVDQSRIGETKEMLKQIAKLEVAQCAARIQAMRASIQGRYEWRLNPGSKTTYGTQTASQAELYLEDMSHLLVKAEQMIESGEVLTIGDAELKLRKLAGSLTAPVTDTHDKLLELKKKSAQDYYNENYQKTLAAARRAVAEWKPFIGPETDMAYLEARKQKLIHRVSQLEKMNPEQFYAEALSGAQQSYNDARAENALYRFNRGMTGPSQVFDVFAQQRILNNPDPKKREEGMLKLAKAARDNGLPSLARQYYDMYFAKELEEESKKITKAEVLKKFVESEENGERINEQVEKWKEDFKKKAGREATEDEIGEARGQMVGFMVDDAYSTELKKRVHVNFQGKDTARAKAWDEAYGGVVAVEDIGQEGMFEGIWTDESWNELPKKVTITASIIIVSIGTAGAATEALALGRAASAVATRLLGKSAVARAIAWGAEPVVDLAVESLFFASTEGMLNGVVEGDWSTYASGGSFLKAWGHNILTLGVIKGVGGGVGALRGARTKAAFEKLTEEQASRLAFMPKSLGGYASDAAWWAGRTAAESTALTGMAWAQAKIGGRAFGARDAFRSFGENVVFSAAIGIGMKAGAHGEGKAKEKPKSKADRDVAKAGEKATRAEVKAAAAEKKAADYAKRTGKESPKLRAEAKAKRAEADKASAELSKKAEVAVEADKVAMEKMVAAQEAHLLEHIEGMCPCHRQQMRDMAKIDLAGKSPAEKMQLIDKALARIKEYRTQVDKNGHVSKAIEKYLERALDSHTAEGKRVDAALEGKTVEVEVKLPDGTARTEKVPVRKELLTPDTILKLAAGEPLEMSMYDSYIHKHLAENMDARLHDVLTIHENDPPDVVKVKKAFQKEKAKLLEGLLEGKDIRVVVKDMVESLGLPPRAVLELAGKINAEGHAAMDKVKQGVEIFTKPHAEKNAEGIDISRQYMHETVDKLFDDFATKFEAETGKKVDKKLLDKIKERILLAGIDQHIDNPPQYVSHGFDHSLRVMENVARVVKGSPEAVEGMMTKYKLTESQARLMMLMVGVCHDFGYPTVGDLTKSLHAVTGTYRFLSDIAVPLAKAIGLDMKLPEHQNLIKNFANSIECHSADKVETSYTDPGDTKQTLKFDRKLIVEIKIPGTDMTYQHEFLFMSRTFTDYPGGENAVKADLLSFFERSGIETTGKVTEHVEIRDGKPVLFEGRYLDLPGSSKKGLLPAGIAYRGAEMVDQAKASRHQVPSEAVGRQQHKFDPLLALVRYADNLDMQESRFSEFQKSEPFKRLYERLGAERRVATTRGEKIVSSAAAEALAKGTLTPEKVADLLPKSPDGQKPAIYEGELLSLVKKLNGEPPEVRTAAIKRLIEVLRTADILKFGNPPEPLSSEARQKIIASLERIASISDPAPKPLNKLIQSTMADIIYAEESANPNLSAADKKYLPYVKKFLSSLNEESFRHFGGCRPVENVEVQGGSMVITMRPDVIRAYRGLVAAEKIPGRASPMNVPVNVYQVWRGVDSFESLTVNRKKMKLVIKVEGAPDFIFDPNADVPEGGSASAEFVDRYTAWEKEHIQ